MAWKINLDDEQSIALGDFPPKVISDIAVANGVLWTVVLDSPLTNLGVATSLIAWARPAHGLKLPPLRTATEAFEAISEMFEEYDEDEITQEEDSAPIAWEATG